MSTSSDELYEQPNPPATNTAIGFESLDYFSVIWVVHLRRRFGTTENDMEKEQLLPPCYQKHLRLVCETGGRGADAVSDDLLLLPAR